MAAKEIIFNTNARDQIAHGVNALANAVKITLGPRVSQPKYPPHLRAG